MLGIQIVKANSIFKLSSYGCMHEHFLIGKSHATLPAWHKPYTNSTIRASSSSMNLDPYIIEFQNRGISLYSLRKRAKCWKVFLKGLKPHFGPQIYIYIYI